jgi:hypothetical protein
VACYNIESVSIFLIDGNKQRQVERLTNEVVWNNLNEKTDYKLQVRVNYEGGKSSQVVEFVFNSGLCALDAPDCEFTRYIHCEIVKILVNIYRWTAFPNRVDYWNCDCPSFGRCHCTACGVYCAQA